VQVRAAGYVSSSDTVTMTGGKREDRSYRLQREAVAVAPPPAAPRPAEAAPPAPSVATTTTTTTTTTTAPSSSPPPSGEPAASLTMPAPAPASDGSSLRPVAWGVGIAGIVGLAVGAGAGLRAISKRNEFNDHEGPDPNMVGGTIKDCNTTFLTPECTAIKESHESARTLSIVGFIAGGALTAGAAVLWILSSPKERAGSTSAFACAPDFGTRGLACRMQF
jgi:hypothetical protein